jgi:hypothetical protein
VTRGDPEKKEKLELVIEQLEERIAPGKSKGNNGFMYGQDPAGVGSDGVPGHSNFQDINR